LQFIKILTWKINNNLLLFYYVFQDFATRSLDEGEAKDNNVLVEFKRTWEQR